MSAEHANLNVRIYIHVYTQGCFIIHGVSVLDTSLSGIIIIILCKMSGMSHALSDAYAQSNVNYVYYMYVHIQCIYISLNLGDLYNPQSGPTCTITPSLGEVRLVDYYSYTQPTHTYIHIRMYTVPLRCVVHVGSPFYQGASLVDQELAWQTIARSQPGRLGASLVDQVRSLNLPKQDSVYYTCTYIGTLS